MGSRAAFEPLKLPSAFQVPADEKNDRAAFGKNCRSRRCGMGSVASGSLGIGGDSRDGKYVAGGRQRRSKRVSSGERKRRNNTGLRRTVRGTDGRSIFPGHLVRWGEGGNRSSSSKAVGKSRPGEGPKSGRWPVAANRRLRPGFRRRPETGPDHADQYSLWAKPDRDGKSVAANSCGPSAERGRGTVIRSGRNMALRFAPAAPSVLRRNPRVHGFPDRWSR